MTAEEYLKSNKFQKPGYAGYYVTLYDAREAVKMARKEEREKVIEKAIKAARTVIYPMSENYEQGNRIVNNFINLLEL